MFAAGNRNSLYVASVLGYVCFGNYFTRGAWLSGVRGFYRPSSPTVTGTGRHPSTKGHSISREQQKVSLHGGFAGPGHHRRASSIPKCKRCVGHDIAES